jgi:pentapeptide MXKDX repeat protein
MEILMKKFLIATTALTLMCGSAFAQNTGPAPQQDNMTKPGQMNNSTDKGSMEKGSMDKGTTGMNNDGMKKEGMSKEGMKNDSMTKDGMKK